MEKNTKHENFRRIAEARTEKILDMLDLIGNLSNTSFYEYSEMEIEKIFNTISESLEKNKRKFKKIKIAKGDLHYEFILVLAIE